MLPAFDEMTLSDGTCRPGYDIVKRWLESTPRDVLAHRRAEAELLFRRIGITFAVYGTAEAEERIIPFDIIPRILTPGRVAAARAAASSSVSRRSTCFLADIYGPGEILKAGAVPADLVYRNPYFRPEMAGLKLPHDVYVHIAGIDIVRTDDGRLLRSRGQCPHALRRLLHAGEPRGDDAASSPISSPSTASTRSRPIPRSCWRR